MTTLIDTLSGPAWRQILLTLAHSLWQGAALALLLAAVLSRIAGDRPQSRYLASLVSLALLVVSSLVTWSVLDLPPALAVSRPVAAEQATSARSPETRSTASVTDLIPLHPQPAYSSAIAAAPADSDIDFPATASAICTAIWLAGVLAMLARMAWLVTVARRLSARPPLTDPRVLDLVKMLRQRLGILRSITVVDSATIGPAVLGILRPVLLLPAAIVAELPADCLEAILAHELAHIRRHDYLVNLVQMLVEAALFFNPAVWWISRQIRREREACCDALAVGITGRPLTYAQALTAWLERMHAGRFSPATAGWLGQGGRGTVLDRVRRLVIAGYRPELRGSWTALATGLAVSLLMLAALCAGTRASVALAAEILLQAQRIEELAKERNELRPLENSDAESTLAGTVRTADGEPIPPKIDVKACAQMRPNSRFRAVDSSLTGRDFSFQAPWGKTWLIASAAGFAPALLTPFGTKPGETHGGLEIVLAAGFTSYIQVVDRQGEPVPGATVTATLDDTGCRLPSGWTANDQGLVAADHLADFPYKLHIAAPGFQTLRSKPLKFSPDQTIAQTLAPATPTRGVVVSPNGDPVAGAVIRRTHRKSGFMFVDDMDNPVLATTDSAGRFTLDSLDDGATYGFLVETSDQGRRFILEVRAGDSDLRWVVGPDFTVNGQLLGDIGRLPTRNGAPQIRYEQTATTDQGVFELVRGESAVTSVAGQHRFHLKNLFPGNLMIYPGGGEVLVQVEKPVTDVTFNVPATRHVVLRFVGTDDGLSPQGEIWIQLSGPDRLSNWNVHSFQSNIAIENGVVEFDAYVGGRASYGMENVIGYWFKTESFPVPAGTMLLKHDVAVVAAGGIRGQILNADGTPVGKLSVSIAALTIEKPPGASVAANPSHLENIPVENSGECFVSPLPLGGLYVLRASRGFEIALNEPIRVDAGNPRPSIKVQLSKPRNIVGQVLGPNGKPVTEAAVHLELRGGVAATRYMPPQKTDRDGRFELCLSSGISEYWVRIIPIRDFQPIDVQVPLDGSSLEIRPKAGEVIEGQLLDTKTGAPLAGVQVVADSNDPESTRQWYDGEEQTTDVNGRFRFGALAAGTYRIYPTGDVSFPSFRTAHTGESIELRAHVHLRGKKSPSVSP